MPVNKSAFKRWLIIVRELRLASYEMPLNRFALAEKVSDELGIKVSCHSIENDINDLRNDEDLSFFVPIRARNKGYWLERTYSLSARIKELWNI